MSKLRVSAALLAAIVSIRSAVATDLYWDYAGTSPTNPLDGSGTWDLTSRRWSDYSTDTAWSNGSDAYIGNGTASGSFTITLGANISANSVTFSPTASGGGWTLNGSGHTLTVTGVDEGIYVGSVGATLTNGTFNVGSTSVQGFTYVYGGGGLILGPGAVLKTAGVFGDSDAATAYFRGGTVVPTADGYSAVSGFTGTYSGAFIGTGGLTVDTSLIPNGQTNIYDYDVYHDGTAGAVDGGLTKNGPGTLNLGYSEGGYDTLFLYTGPTTVNAGVLVLDSSGNKSGTTGPFNTSGFVVNTNGTLSLRATDAVIGLTGNIPITINGGILYVEVGTLDGAAVDGSSHVANVALNGGSIQSDPTGSLEFIPGKQLVVTANSTLSINYLTFDAGSTVNISSTAIAAMSSALIDNGAQGTLTLVGGGFLDVKTPVDPSTGVVDSNFTGPVNIASGTLVMDTANTPTGLFPKTSGITVNSGGTLLLAQSNTLTGTAGSTPVTINAGGTMNASAGATNRIADLTLNGGQLIDNTAALNSSGTYIFQPNSVVSVTTSSSIAARGLVPLGGSQFTVASGATLTVSGTIVDGVGAGTVTKTGPGAMVLSGTNTYTGATNVAAGTLTLAATGTLASTGINVAAGATFNDLGTLNNSAVSVYGTATFTPPPTTTVSPLNLSLLAVFGTVTVTAAATHADRVVVVTSAFYVVGGTFDLTNNDLIVHNGNLTAVTAAAKAGITGATGLTSSTAAADVSHRTALGVIQNNQGGVAIYTAAVPFDGLTPQPPDVIAKYTWFGDANLDGRVDGSDYSRIDFGFLNPTTTGWFNGDFNYDGRVDASDYTLIDNGYNRQALNLSTAELIVTPSASSAAAVPEPSTPLMSLIGLYFRRGRRSAESKDGG